MRILAIDHTAVQRSNREFYGCLAANPDVALTLLVPEVWRENYADMKAEHAEDGSPYRLVTGAIVFKGRPHMMLFVSALSRLVREKPDVIYVNAEPENFIMVQVILLCRALSPKSRIVCVTWRNIQYTWRSFPYKCGPLHAIAERISFRYAHACRAMISDGGRLLREKGFAHEIRVVPWGVDVNRFRAVPAESVRSSCGLRRKVVGYMGRIVKPKGIDLLIRALSKIGSAEVSLAIVGNGPEKAFIEKMLRESADSVHSVVIDTVDYRDVPQWLSAMDILVLPSRTTKTWKEQFGRVLIEAMSCGTAVVGSDSGEIPFVIGDSGMVFKEGDVDDLAQKLGLMIHDDAVRSEYVRKGRERVMASFAWSRVSEQMYGLFKAVADR